MKVYLVRHGEALPPEIDPEKALSPQGRIEIEHIARFLAKKSFPLSAVLHSEKLRAKQTAEIIAEAIAPDLKPEEQAHLNPNDSIHDILIRIEAEDGDLMIVGHLPFLAKLTGFLLSGDENLEAVQFRQGSTVCLESINGSWVIDWMVGLDQV